MADLFTVLTVEQAREKIAARISGRGVDEVGLDEACGRFLAEDITAPGDLPGFARSTVDGFAVRAKDTFGASEGLPSYLELDGEVLMGREAGGRLGPGRAMRIPTGGMLPQGADAVLMMEYSEEVDGRLVGMTRPVAPFENVVRPDEDVARGALVLSRHHRLRPQDVGVLGALGIVCVKVLKRPRVAVISTGDELVAPGLVPGPGQVRDINSIVLSALVREDGGIPVPGGIIRDRLENVEEALLKALADCDLVLVSGGSSVGARDHTAQALTSSCGGEVLFHGLALKPGKPTIGAVSGGKAVFGLPGHPVSAMVVYYLLVRPLVQKGDYSGEQIFLPARVTRNLSSAAGREDYVRVRLKNSADGLWAEPVLGKSGLINTMASAHALARIPLTKEGVEAGEKVEVYFWGKGGNW